MFMVHLKQPIDALDDWDTLGAEETPSGTRVYFSHLRSAKAFARIHKSKVQAAEWTIDLSYQDAWQPAPLGQSLWLMPEGHTAPEGKIGLEMKRGLVFGAGDHETTRGCLELLESTPLANKSVFDLGCGTGILAEAALRLGAARVVACDLDWDAAVMTHNRQVPTFQGPSSALPDQAFDVLLANIPGLAHLDLIPEYQRLLRPRGHLILSGYYETQSQRLEEALNGFQNGGFKKQAQRPSRDGWVAATFSKTSQA
jgi:ribosomal protein L11 methyltransferase